MVERAYKLCFSLGLFWLAAFGLQRSAIAAEGEPAPPPPHTPQPLVIEGRVESSSGVRRLAFGRSGRITRVDAQVGDKVRRDQVLASLNCNDVRADLTGAEAELELQQLSFARRAQAPDPTELEVATERLSLAKADLLAAETTRERLDSLFKKNGLASKQELEVAARRSMAARLDVAAAQFALDRLQRRVLPEDEHENATREKVASANVARIRHQLSLCDLAAPADGTVVAVNSKPGEVAGGLDTIVAIVSDDDRLVSVFIPEAALSRVRVGQKLKIKVPAFKDAMLDGAVARMQPLLTTAAGPQNFARCTDACGMQAWIDPTDKLASVPLYSLAYIYVP